MNTQGIAHAMRTRIKEIDQEHAKASKTLDKILLNRQPHVAGQKKQLMEQLSRLEAERDRICERLANLQETDR